MRIRRIGEITCVTSPDRTPNERAYLSMVFFIFFIFGGCGRLRGALSRIRLRRASWEDMCGVSEIEGEKKHLIGDDVMCGVRSMEKKSLNRR